MSCTRCQYEPVWDENDTGECGLAAFFEKQVPACFVPLRIVRLDIGSGNYDTAWQSPDLQAPLIGWNYECPAFVEKKVKE